MSPLPPTRERPVTGNLNSSQPEWGGGEPPKRTRRWLKRIGVIFIVLLAIVLGAAAATVFIGKQKIDDFVTATTPDGKAAQKVLSKPIAGKPTNILVLGSDNRNGAGKAGSNSDTMMLVRLDPQEQTISILSFPRDLYVPIPGHGEQKINAAYAEGGTSLTIQTIKQLTDLDVNFVMNVDFKGFQDLVEQLSGIYVDVDRPYFVAEGSGHSAIDLQAGYQRLRGRNALAFARHRISDSDFHRIARQQLVLTSLKKQLAGSSLRKNIPGLINIFNKNVEAVAGGGNDVPYGVLKDFITLGLGLSGKDIYQIEYDGTTGNAGDASIVVYEQAKMQAAVKAFLAPSKAAQTETADALLGTKATDTADKKTPPKTDEPAVVDPKSVTVTVLNGSGITGAARGMGSSLQGAGYSASVKTTPADNQNYASTKVLYRDAADQAAAEQLAANIDGSSTAKSDGSNPFDTKLLVVVGKVGTTLEGGGNSGTTGTDGGSTGGTEYDGNKVPEKAAPKIQTDIEYGKVPFLDLSTASTKLPFPILYPTVRPTGTTFDDPVKAYKVAKGKQFYDAYRLVGKVEGGFGSVYWGLQATNWPNPPILDSPTRTLYRNGRNYQLYFNGTRLHRIAWKQTGGTYWIENSLLDKINNETMLAVAAGIKTYK